MILLDTHALIWWVSDPSKLSLLAKKLITQAQGKKAIYVSAITFWEIAMLHQKNRLTLKSSLDKWLQSIYQLQSLTIIPIDHLLTVDSVLDPHIPHSDPADRLIVTTALYHRLPLITKDTTLHSLPHLKTIW